MCCRCIHSLTKRQSYSLQSLDKNLKWTKYTSPRSKSTIEIAEVDNIDSVFDEAIRSNLPEPFGIVTWDSSYLAADIIDTYIGPQQLEGKVVCDLGCGTGLTSLLCLSHGAHVVALDNNEVSLALCKVSHGAHAKKQALPGTLLPVTFDLEGPIKLPTCDILIVSDLLYYEHLAVKVAERIREAVTNSACVVLVTDPGRLSAPILISSLEHMLHGTKYVPQLHFVPYVVAGVSKGNYMLLR